MDEAHGRVLYGILPLASMRLPSSLVLLGQCVERHLIRWILPLKRRCSPNGLIMEGVESWTPFHMDGY